MIQIRFALLTGLIVVGAAACAGDEGGGGSTPGNTESVDAGGASSGGSYSDAGPSGTSTDTGAASTPGGTADTGSGSSGGEGSAADAGAFQDAGSGPDPSSGADAGSPGGNTNVGLSGASDIGFFRRLLDDGIVPRPEDISAEGFFSEHHTPLPPPACGERICLQAMLGVMGNLVNGQNCTLLQLGLNSPIVADPGARPPLSLAVVVDVSGSMDAAGKIDFVRDGLELLIDSMHDGDQIALVTYSDLVTVEFEMADVADNRSPLRELVRSLVAQGGTDLYGGLERGFEEVLENYDSGRQNRVILLSDGQPTVGITDTQVILDMSRAFNSEGLGLTTVGLGTSFNIALMEGLARQGDGNFYFVEDAGAVDEVFTEELSYFTVPVAFDLTLTVEAGDQYDFGQAYGSTFWEDTDQGGFLDVPSVFLAHRESHDDVTEDGGRRGGGSALLIELMPDVSSTEPGDDSGEVAMVDVAFREPGSNRIVTDHVVVTYPHPPWELLETGYFDAPDEFTIQKSFVMLNIFVALQGACRMFHLGAPEEAIGTLQRLIAAVEDFNEEIGDVDMSYDIELMQQLIDVIRDNGGEDPVDNQIPDDPWPAD